ncbi:uncharacterized protein ISCGN_029752 [Ixodes scapularis]
MKARERKKDRSSLTRCLKRLIEEENVSPGLFTEDIRNCKERLLAIMEKDYEGAMIRSRVLSVEKDEVPGKIFKTKERQRAQFNKISQLQVGPETVSEQAAIEQALHMAFEKLLGVDSFQDGELLQSFLEQMPSIPADVREAINEDITEAEVASTIKELSPRKSPGVDGLGAAFYKKFADLLVPLLCRVFSDILARDLLPPSMRQAMVVLIPKKRSPHSCPSVEDFRPISILTTDYKILAKILAKRLDRGIRCVVGDHQAYGIRGRSIQDNLHMMRVIAAKSVSTCTRNVQIDQCSEQEKTYLRTVEDGFRRSLDSLCDEQLPASAEVWNKCLNQEALKNCTSKIPDPRKIDISDPHLHFCRVDEETLKCELAAGSNCPASADVAKKALYDIRMTLFDIKRCSRPKLDGYGGSGFSTTPAVLVTLSALCVALLPTKQTLLLDFN